MYNLLVEIIKNTNDMLDLGKIEHNARVEFNLSQDILSSPCVTLIEALPGVLENRGEKCIYIRGTGEQRPNFEGNKDNIGTQGT